MASAAGNRIEAIKRLYDGFSICLASSCIHLWIGSVLCEMSMRKMKRDLDMEVSQHPLIKWDGDVHKFAPTELKPVEFYPWNVLFGSASAFAAKTITYPLDTLRLRYQHASWSLNSQANRIHSVVNQMLTKCLHKTWPIRDLVRHISIWTPFSKSNPKNEARETKKVLYPNAPDEPSSISRLWDGVQRLVGARSDDPQAEAQRYFQYSVERLMAQPGKFTLEKFKVYLEELCTKLRLIGKGSISEDDIIGPLLQLRNQYIMTKAFTPTELAADSSSIFSFESKRLIGEYAKVTVKQVDEMLLHYDTCKLDRTWYFRRLCLGRPLPANHKEREYLAYQRPIARMARQIYPKVDSVEVERIRKHQEEQHYTKIP
ncbi:bifunctional Mitochondrial carrier domain superfamily/Mitochondrial substrate-solute carrier [Babesia duncani]|uniref:Bifunctional Mitochondrial carrier domain superfamily/Mitochondrial substrate-solute carrier n=1 Tax=Babesia duncani TaxID=323732 RepID=A0AAD9UQH2_9APIC|nr:bifunctional Mitochondrial carrier domain superfamily/Mitochondrial substrate-solute carrier [Babesia duncani]